MVKLLSFSLRSGTPWRDSCQPGGMYSISISIYLYIYISISIYLFFGKTQVQSKDNLWLPTSLGRFFELLFRKFWHARSFAKLYIWSKNTISQNIFILSQKDTLVSLYFQQMTEVGNEKRKKIFFAEFHKLICNVKKSNPHQIYFDFFI